MKTLRSEVEAFRIRVRGGRAQGAEDAQRLQPEHDTGTRIRISRPWPAPTILIAKTVNAKRARFLTFFLCSQAFFLVDIDLSLPELCGKFLIKEPIQSGKIPTLFDGFQSKEADILLSCPIHVGGLILELFPLRIAAFID